MIHTKYENTIIRLTGSLTGVISYPPDSQQFNRAWRLKILN